MYSFKIFSRRFLWKMVTGFVVVALALSPILPGAVQTAGASTSPTQAGQTNGTCESVTNQGNLFLPIITSPAQSVATVLSAVLNGTQAVERKLKYEVGKTYVYNYAVTVLSKSSTRNLNSADVVESDKSKTVMAAVAEVSITGQESDGTFLGQVVMKVPYVCSADLKNGQESIADTTALVAELLKPLLFKQKPSGAVTAVSYPADAHASVINMQKGVINALQTTLQDGSDTYTVPEVGAQGTYTASYKLQEQNNQLNITKSYDQDSYSKLTKQGDEIKSLQLKSALTSVLDGAKGVLSSVESNESIITGDGAAEPNSYTDPDVKFDGATVWSTVTSTGKLTLTEVKAASNVYVAAPNEPYVDGGLEPIFENSPDNPRGVDLATVDLAQEFAAFEAAPTDPTKFQRILDLVRADKGDTVFNKLVERLQASAGTESIAKTYIDLLTVIGTPQAQKVLTDVLTPGAQASSISATMTMTTQEQALIDLVLIASPTTTTVNTVKGLSSDTNSPFQDISTAVLGGVIHNLSDEDANTAKSLANDLAGSLSNTTDRDKVELYLDALGNAGVADTLNTISQYTNIGDTQTISETDAIEAAAFNALRRIPGQQAEGLLVAALEDTAQPNGTRLLIADILSSREDLSSNGATALDNFQIGDLAGSGTYTRYWGSWLGNSKLGVYFPGQFTVSSINQLYLYADQQANGYVWNRSISLARGQALSYRSGSYQLFGAYLNLGGNLISKKYERWFNCADSTNGTLWSGSYSWKFHVDIPIIWVITIGVDVNVSVNAALDYGFGVNICNLNNSSLYGGITPRAWAGVTAEAYLNLRLARGGVGINATILNTRMPTQLTLTYNGSNFRFCSNVRISTEPFSGYIYAFADYGIDFWLGAIWKRAFQGNLATFSVGRYDYNVLVACW